jgi:hypothetical protein
MNKNIKFLVVGFLIFLTVLVMYKEFLTFEYEDSSISDDSKIEQSINIFDDNQNYLFKYEPEEGTEVLLKSIVGEVATKDIAVIRENGEICKINSDVYIGKNKAGIFCTDVDKKNTVENVVGIYLSDNFKSITDTYYDIKNYIDNDKKIMVVLLDGFGYNEYNLVKSNGYVLFLSQFFKNTALSVYTPVTNAGYAAMITGQTPDINGVHDRSVRKMNVDSIFKYALEKGKKAILLEGDIKILNTEIEPQLHIDLNKDSDTDDDMFDSCLNILKDDYDLIFIHFHGIDDRGHAYGTQSAETLNYIRQIDGYIQKISEIWGNSIILTADHGMHDIENGGNHGECRVEDMIVPYFVIGD